VGLKERVKFMLFAFLGTKVIHCIGDSHTGVFEYIQENFTWKKTKFRFCIVPGATAMGLANPNSKTDAIGTYRKYLKTVPKTHNLLFSLGEVDCGFVIWYRAKKHGLTVDEQFDLSLGNYKSFLDEVRIQGFKSIFVLSATLPTIQDGQDWGEIAKLRAEQLTRKEVRVSLKERTELTRRYNQELRNYCALNGLNFIDLESDTLDQATGLVQSKFLNKDALDFHQDRENVSACLVPRLHQHGFW